ncbi:1, 4-beta cellobiohydrolase [Apiosordaria backusii]|uniref:Glucanase n=1 Tax=Apiosordaria backusii TaxID=314023 RepID=A0AA40BL42_9PEZI|nr:1, 4-beta cellobiohydrolase [Apiosordaria backusii]
MKLSKTLVFSFGIVTYNIVSALPSEGTSAGCQRVALNASTNIWQGYILHQSDPDYAQLISLAAGRIQDETLTQKALKVADAGTFLSIDNPQAFSKLERTLQESIPCNHIVGVTLQGMGLPEQGSYSDWPGYKMPIMPEEHKRVYVDPLASMISANPSTAFALIIEPFTLPAFIKHDGRNLSMLETIYHASIPYALESLGNLPNAILYLDAGHGGLLGWHQTLPLVASNISAVYKVANSPPQFRGIAINTHNYNAWDLSPGEFATTRETRNYAQNEQTYLRLLGTRLQQLGVPNNAIMDTSRNGIHGLREEWDRWCNVYGAGLGRFPGPNLQPGQQELDAFIWAKGPGYSDGSSDSVIGIYRKYCGGIDAHKPSPERGEWFQEYFETLVREAHPSVGV